MNPLNDAPEVKECPTETPEQTKARLFISYRMAQHEIQRAIDALLSRNPLTIWEQRLDAAKMYADSAAYVLQNPQFDLENTSHESKTNDR